MEKVLLAKRQRLLGGPFVSSIRLEFLLANAYLLIPSLVDAFGQIIMVLSDVAHLTIWSTSVPTFSHSIIKIVFAFPQQASRRRQTLNQCTDSRPSQLAITFQSCLTDRVDVIDQCGKRRISRTIARCLQGDKTEIYIQIMFNQSRVEPQNSHLKFDSAELFLAHCGSFLHLIEVNIFTDNALVC